MRATFLIASLEECLFLKTSLCKLQLEFFTLDLTLVSLNVLHDICESAEDLLAGQTLDTLLWRMPGLAMSIECSFRFEVLSTERASDVLGWS